ncbi:MAG TPA: hypothetical protein VGC80_16625 [Acetobacteraceae bacterium]
MGVPGWFWMVAVLALLWEAVGCFAYLGSVTMKASDMAQYSAAQRTIFEATPAWIWAAYAVAVWVGLTGALALLMRHRWARLAFTVSLAAAVIQFAWVLFGTPALKTLGASATAVPICVIVIGAFLIWFSDAATRHGWLR